MSHFKRKSLVRVSEGGHSVDYKDINTIRNFITESGKIVPRRITGVNAAYQRAMSQAIKRARFLALIPFCDSHI